MNYFQVCDPTVGQFNSTKAALHEILNNLFRFQTELQVNGDVETFYRRRHAERRAGEWMNDYETKRKTDGDDGTFPNFLPSQHKFNSFSEEMNEPRDSRSKIHH